jgi:histidine triad (HIT) family protein
LADFGDCLFCKVVRGEIKGDLIHQDDAVTVFRDINPQAPVHVLLVPNQHVASTNELGPDHDALVGRLVRTAAEVAVREGISDSGYRVVTNCGRQAGQTVDHLHLHLLGGRQMTWPPG